MKIIDRFVDIMGANVNAFLEHEEDENADKLLEKYIQDAKDNLGNVKAQTAAVIAEEMAAARHLSDCDAEIKKYEAYASAAVNAANDDDARKFLGFKAEAAAKRAELASAYEAAKQNSEKMRSMTQKLTDDLQKAQAHMTDLKTKMTFAEAQEKENKVMEKLDDGMGGFDNLFDKVQKRVDEAQAAASLAMEGDGEGEKESLMNKYAMGEPMSHSIDDELARLKSAAGRS